jgi:DNA-binding CsgD family transcriptional regulator
MSSIISLAYAEWRVIPDMAINRGQQAYERARALGERQIECLSAIGTALVYCELADLEAATTWLDRAQAVAANAPTPYRALRLATARAVLAAAQQDVIGLSAHFARAMEIAAGQRRPAAQCQVRALFVIEAARLGAALGDDELLQTAQSGAAEVRRMAAEMPGRPLWTAQANAAESRVLLSRNEIDEAVALARSALGELNDALRGDPHLEILLPVARSILAGGTADEKEHLRAELQIVQGQIAQRTIDDEIRAAFFRAPLGRELAELTGGLIEPVGGEAAERSGAGLAEEDMRLLRLLIEGRTNREIGEALGLDATSVTQALAALYARVGADSRADATALALRTV